MPALLTKPMAAYFPQVVPSSAFSFIGFRRWAIRFPQYSYIRGGFWVEGASFVGVVQVFPEFLQAPLQHGDHFSQLAGHIAEHKMYYIMRNKVYWPHVAKDVYTTLKYYVKFTLNEANKETLHLKFFLSSICSRSSPPTCSARYGIQLLDISSWRPWRIFGPRRHEQYQPKGQEKCTYCV